MVPKISLSMVPGIPMTGKLYSSLKISAPVKVPSPPMVTKASTPAFVKLSKAFLRPSLVLNSSDRADFKTVPPLFIIPFTLRASMDL